MIDSLLLFGALALLAIAGFLLGYVVAGGLDEERGW